MAPVIKRLELESDRVESVVCATGQHRQLLDQALELLQIHPHVDLGAMQPDQPLAKLTARLIELFDEVVTQYKPDWILAQGDTTSVLVASMVSFYRHVAFGHVEAGLRSGDLDRPFPEEFNRRVSDQVARLLFAPTERNRRTLLAEGFSDQRIIVTGNTVIDALNYIQTLPYDWSSGPLSAIPHDQRLVLITCHRRESFGQPLKDVFSAIRELAESFQHDTHFVYPVHLNPNVQELASSLLAGQANIHLLQPLDYLSLVNLMKRSHLILTDSGGIQEEAPGLGVPVLVMRDKTERPEGIDAGVAKLIGTSGQRIVDEASLLLRDPKAREQMARCVHPYGDGMAADRIVTKLMESAAS